MNEWQKKITFDPEQCGGRPCIRGLRIRVTDIIDLLATGLNQDEIIEELPDLEKEDILAALKYASQKLDHPVIAALSSGSMRICHRHWPHGSTGLTRPSRQNRRAASACTAPVTRPFSKQHEKPVLSS